MSEQNEAKPLEMGGLILRLAPVLDKLDAQRQKYGNENENEKEKEKGKDANGK